MTVQPTLFPPVTPVPLNKTAPVAATKRLSGQQRKLIARLQQGRATNGELSKIAMRYSARFGELKAAGWDIRIVSNDHKSGLVIYALFVDGEEMP